MEIFKALIGVMRDLTPIVASHKHPQGWQYRGVDDIYNHLQPLLARHGIVTIPNVRSVERSTVATPKGGQLFHALVTVEYTFYAEDGSSVSCVVAGEGTDSLDNAVTKAMTDAHCKALVQIFVIPKGNVETERSKPQPQQITPNGGIESHTKRFMAELNALGIAYKGNDREWVKGVLAELGYSSAKDIPAQQVDHVLSVIRDALPKPKTNTNRERLLAVAKELGGNGAMCKDAIESRYPGKTAVELNDKEVNDVVHAMLTRWAVAQGYKNGDPNQVARSFSEWLERERLTIGDGKDNFIATTWGATVNAWVASRSA